MRVAILLLLVAGTGLSHPAEGAEDLAAGLKKYSAITDSLLYANVEGVIENRSTSQTARYVEVGVELLQGERVVASGWTNETDVRAGERRPFRKMIRTEGLGRWLKYRISIRECKL